MCLACEDNGFSTQDCKPYPCASCGPRGHLKFARMDLKNAKRREGMDKLLCEDCFKKRREEWKCAACKEKQTEEFFDADILRHARFHGRTLVCRRCQDEGFSPKDCEAYHCGLCRPRGHLKFTPHTLKNYKRPGRTSKLLCADCVETQRAAEKTCRQLCNTKMHGSVLAAEIISIPTRSACCTLHRLGKNGGLERIMG